MNRDEYGKFKQGLSGILSATWHMYTGHFALFFALSAVTIPVDIATSALAIWALDPTNSEGQVFWVLMTIVQYAFALLASAAIVSAAAKDLGGQPIGFAAAYANALDRFGTLWWSSLRVVFHVLLYAVTIIGIPWAIQRLVRWFFVEQTVVIEGMNAKDSLSGSAAAVLGNWWETFGSMIVLVLLVLIPTGVTTAAFWAAPPLVSVPVGAAVTAVSTPFLAIGFTLLYFDLKARKGRAESDGLTPA